MKKIVLAILIIMFAGLAIGLGIHTYRSRKPVDDRAAALEMLRNGHYLSALKQFAEHGDARDIASVTPLLENEELSVRFHAAQTLARLSGHDIPVPPTITNRSDFSGPGWVDYYNLSDTNLVEQYVTQCKKWVKDLASQQSN